MADEIKAKRSPLIWIIEAFSLLTGAGFVVSGIANEITFQLGWGISFISIASPSDVIMSGFSVVGTALFTVASFMVWDRMLTAVIADEVNRISGNDEFDPRPWSLLRIAIVWRTFRNWVTPFAIIPAIAGGAILGFSSGFARAPFVFPSFELRPDDPVISARLDASPIAYRTGLKVAPSAQVEPDCRGAPVLWLGSAAAIVGCERGVRVFHKLDDIVTEPLSVKRDPKEYLPPVQAAASKAAISAPPCRDEKPECDPWERAWKAGETPPEGSVVARDGAITPPSKP